MKRRIGIGVLQVTAAVLALGILFMTMVGHMMEPSGGGIGTELKISAVVVLIITAVVLLGGVRSYWLAVAAAGLTVLVSMAPEIVHSTRRIAYQAGDEAERNAIEAKFLVQLAARKKDVDERIAAGRPYTPEASLDFMFFVANSDLRYRLRGNHSEEALALLKRALVGKVVDPNGWIEGPPVVDVTPDPLFLHYYRRWARSARRGPVDAMRWKVMRLVAENGADLTMPAAVGLVEDLAKPERPGVTYDWIVID
jgi:uncharacterized spore protein YtfJ